MKTKPEKTRTVLSFDYAMKKLLCQKSNFKILEGFLSELLGRDIFINKILESESNQDDFDDKQTRIDILAEDVKGELMLVEVQYQFEIDYLLRILYGVSRNITEFLKRGDNDAKIRKVYSVSILYFKEFNTDNEYIYHGKTEFKGIHTDTVLHLTAEQKKKFEFETAGDLYPEYYLLDVTNFNNIAKSTLDEWIYYFKNSEIKETFSAKGMQEVKTHLDFEKLTPSEKRRYEKAIDIKLGWESAIDTAKIQGIEEGREEGREEGKTEKETEIVLTAAKMGLSVQQISELTKLTIEQIKEIIQ